MKPLDLNVLNHMKELTHYLGKNVKPTLKRYFDAQQTVNGLYVQIGCYNNTHAHRYFMNHDVDQALRILYQDLSKAIKTQIKNPLNNIYGLNAIRFDFPKVVNNYNQKIAVKFD